jgi:hypothetical protein
MFEQMVHPLFFFVKIETCLLFNGHLGPSRPSLVGRLGLAVGGRLACFFMPFIEKGPIFK